MNIARTVLDSYQVRKTKKQKSRFIDFVDSYSRSVGYQCHVEKGVLGVRNIVVGDTKAAKVVYTAHYDTCARLPFPNFITPKKLSIYFLYQLVIVLAAIVLGSVLAFAVGFVAGKTSELLPIESELLDTVVPIITFICVLAIVLFVLSGPANKHTANDNTSGVVTLLEIMRKMPEDKRENAAFVFFDHEESGLFGSMSYASKHKDEKKEKLIINFDCVSDGKYILFALCKGAVSCREILERNFVGNDELSVEIVDKGVFYPSDQMCFQRGVGVAALNYSKKLKTLYMDKIHTKNDTVFEENNIEFLSDGAVKLACEQ